jgi:hypothetical protein
MNKPHNLPPNLQNIDWYAIALKIRKKYEALQQTVQNLEKSLTGYQKELKKKDIVLEQKNGEIEKYRNELNQFTNHLEEKQDNKNQQQQLIEKLTLELKESQVQRGRLERECSLLQENYNQQEYQLKEKEKENKELHIRLQRQQRVTLEYKAVLDRHLEGSSHTEYALINPRKSPIKSWSELNYSSSNSQNQVNTKWLSDQEEDKSLFDIEKEEKKVESEDIIEPISDETTLENQEKNEVESAIVDQEKKEEESGKKDIESSLETRNGNKNIPKNNRKKFMIDFPNFEN